MIFELPKNKCCMDTMFQNENTLFEFIGTMINVYADMQEDFYNRMEDIAEEQKKEWLNQTIWDYILSIKLTYEPILGMLYHSGAVKNTVAREIIFDNFVNTDED